MEESRDKNNQVWKNIFTGIIIAIITGLIISVSYGIYSDHLDKKELETQIEPLLRKASNLSDSGEFEEAIDVY